MRHPSILALALLACPPLAAQTSGVLLGYWDENGQRHRTLWIHHSGDAAVTEVIPGLLIPRETGFWQLANYFTLNTEDKEYLTDAEHLRALPADRQPAMTLAPNEKLVQGWVDGTCEGTSREVHFVGPSYISYTLQTDSSCGPHPDSDAELRVAPLDQLEGDRIPASRFLGPAAPAAIREAVARVEGSDCFEKPHVDERNWQITRRQGHWSAEGWAATHRICGYGVEFAIGLPLPESVVGYDRLPADWNALKQSIPGLFDALCSPTGDLLIATTEKDLQVYRLDHGKLGRMILRRTWTQLHMDSGEGWERLPLVMAQWATGPNVARWTRELHHVGQASRPVVSPSPHPAAPAPPPSSAPDR